MITVIHPSRSRPDMAFKTFENWMSKAVDKNIQWIVSLDNDDGTIFRYKSYFSEVIINQNSNLVQAVQRGIPFIKNDLVIVVSDDFDCPDRWDEDLKKVCEGKDEFAIYVNDDYSLGKKLLTLPILSHSLIKKLGYIYYPGYTGMFADNDIYEVCESLGCILDATHLIFPHLHYTNGKARMDATYRRHNNRTSWVIGENLLKKRRELNFNLAGKEKPVLSILVATVEDRKKQFDELIWMLNNQIFAGAYDGQVEIKSICDDRKISIGTKRQQLLEIANGEWIVFFDDDDIPSANYVKLIMNAIESDKEIDCIGINGNMTTNGRSPKKWCHRLGFPFSEHPQRGFDYLRPIIHFNPVKKEKALLAGFKDMTFGEDFDYARRLNPFLTKEVYIPEPLFHYRYISKK